MSSNVIRAADIFGRAVAGLSGARLQSAIESRDDRALADAEDAAERAERLREEIAQEVEYIVTLCEQDAMYREDILEQAEVDLSMVRVAIDGESMTVQRAQGVLGEMARCHADREAMCAVEAAIRAAILARIAADPGVEHLAADRVDARRLPEEE